MIFVVAGSVILAALLSIAFVAVGPWRWWWRLALVLAQPLLALPYLFYDWGDELCRDFLRATGQPYQGVGFVIMPCLDFLANLLGAHALLVSVLFGALIAARWRGRFSAGGRSASSGSGETGRS